MRLKTLLYNHGLWSQNIRSVGWIGIVYFLVLFFTIPLQFILTFNRDGMNRYHYYEKDLFQILDPLQTFFTFIFPVLLALIIFRYLHNKGAADFFHSLPLKRESLYLQNVLLAILTLLLPVILTGFILIVFYDAVHVSPEISMSDIWVWMGVTILFNLFVFFTSTLVAMVTGMTSVHAAITYILFVLPAGLFALSAYNMEYFLYGYSAEYYLTLNIELLVPFIRAVELYRVPLEGSEVIGYSTLTILFAVCSLFIYKKRKIEAVQQAIAFKGLQPIFKFGVGFCSLLIGGAYFGESQNQIEWIIFGMVSASFIGYFVGEMVIAKTWRVFNQWKGYLYFLISVSVIAAGLQFYSPSFESNLPELDQIENVYFGEDIYFLQAQSINHYENDFTRNFVVKERRNLEKVLKMHKEILVNKQQFQFQEPIDQRKIVIGYTLKNGEKIVREYVLPQDRFLQYFGEIAETDEYKYQFYPLLKLQSTEKINKIVIHPNSLNGVSPAVFITEPGKINELSTILQTELKNEKASDMVSYQDPWAMIEVYIDNNQVLSINLKKSYHQVDKWLKDNRLQERSRITSAIISKMIIAKNLSNGEDMKTAVNQESLVSELEKRTDTMVIADAAQIEESLVNASWYQGGEYMIGIYFKDKSLLPVIYSFNGDNVPSFVREFFSK